MWLPYADFGGQDKDPWGIPKADQDGKGSFSHGLKSEPGTSFVWAVKCFKVFLDHSTLKPAPTDSICELEPPAMPQSTSPAQEGIAPSGMSQSQSLLCIAQEPGAEADS